MWVITTHIGFSCLCYLSCIGIKTVYKKQLKRYRINKKVRFRRIKGFLITFVPVLNVLLPICALYMASLSDEEVRILKMKMEES